MKKTISEIYDCAVLWRSDDADHPDTPPKKWQKALPLMEAAPALLEACNQVLIASENNGNMDDIDWENLRSAVQQARGK